MHFKKNIYVEEDDIRFYVFSNRLYALCLVLHASLIAVFHFIDVRPLLIFNIVSCTIFTVNLFLNRSGRLRIAFHLGIIEITSHAAFAILCLGWGSNFCMYSVAICSVIMFSTFLKTAAKFAEIFLSTALFLFSYIYVKYYGPLYVLDSSIIDLLGFANILIMIPLLTSIFYSFYNITDMLNKRLKHAAEIDNLTGIYNRHFFNEYSEIEIKRVANERKYGTDTIQCSNFALAIIDIDNFKRINDTYGHLSGDKVLIQTVEIIKKALFGRDIICRYGGEEFVILFTKTSKEGAIKASEKIRREVEQASFFFSDTVQDGRMTLNIGFASFDEVRENNITELLRIADDRLYRAKTSGKNKLVCA